MTRRRPGYRASSRAIGSGPVNRAATGPEPQCVTTGTPADASWPHTSSSSGWFGS